VLLIFSIFSLFDTAICIPNIHHRKFVLLLPFASQIYITENLLIDGLFNFSSQEPLMEVFSPGSKNLQTFMMNRLLVHMCREFQAAEKQHLSPYIRIDDFLSQFPFLSEASFRKRIKEYANLQVLVVHIAHYHVRV
jgi:hypothetical protein